MARAPGTDWVSPGSAGFPDQTIRVYDSGQGAAQLRRAFKPKKTLQLGHGQVFRPKFGSGLQIEVTLQGARVASEHAQAFEQMLAGA